MLIKAMEDNLVATIEGLKEVLCAANGLSSAAFDLIDDFDLHGMGFDVDLIKQLDQARREYRKVTR